MFEKQIKKMSETLNKLDYQKILLQEIDLQKDQIIKLLTENIALKHENQQLKKGIEIAVKGWNFSHIENN